jgi:GDPmannose 4,6-dehydratase
VREFIEQVYGELGMPIVWSGEGVNERGIDTLTGRVVVKVDPRYFRPTEVDLLLGDATKAKNKLGWIPKTTFYDLIKIMVEADLKIIAK